LGSRPPATAAADPDRLADELGDRGRELYRAGGRGATTTERSPTGLPKSLSRESSLSATADEERKRDDGARSPPTWPVVPASGAVCTAPSGSRRSNLPTR